jgi:parallel beta-helix repeat protein
MNFYIFDIMDQLLIKTQYSDFQEPLTQVIATKRVDIQQYTPHAPITISSDSEFASQGFNGSGTVTDPYQIEGLNITSSNSVLIVIRHTTAYFTLKNNILNGIAQASLGISLFNVANGTIENNLIFNHESIGIVLDLASYNIITNNTLTNNLNGIKLGPGIEGPRGYNTVTNNAIINNRLNGIISDGSRNNILSNNIVTGNQQGGIWLSGSDESTLSANIISNNSLQGIFLSSSSASTISNNTVLNNGYAGVEIVGSQQITISSNTISNNGNEGLFLSDSSDSNVLNNTVSTNSGYGIHLDDTTQNVIISGNNFLGNNPEGESQAHDVGQGNIFEANYWDDENHQPDSKTDSKTESPFILQPNAIFGLVVLAVVVSALVVIIRKQIVAK